MRNRRSAAPAAAAAAVPAAVDTVMAEQWLGSEGGGCTPNRQPLVHSPDQQRTLLHSLRCVIVLLQMCGSWYTGTCLGVWKGTIKNQGVQRSQVVREPSVPNGVLVTPHLQCKVCLQALKWLKSGKKALSWLIDRKTVQSLTIIDQALKGLKSGNKALMWRIDRNTVQSLTMTAGLRYAKWHVLWRIKYAGEGSLLLPREAESEGARRVVCAMGVGATLLLILQLAGWVGSLAGRSSG
eukprot:1158756-Pelagomonas_calceolata.AAC.13